MKNQEEAAAVAAVLEYIKLYLDKPEAKIVNFRITEKKNNWAKAGRTAAMERNQRVIMKF